MCNFFQYFIEKYIFDLLVWILKKKIISKFSFILINIYVWTMIYFIINMKLLLMSINSSNNVFSPSMIAVCFDKVWVIM